ncbi:MAG: DUF3500 domain-containing protein [Pirellulales bacterium]|nr:DUF3500 domain-containing protein [Pirellulales bacterium]
MKTPRTTTMPFRSTFASLAAALLLTISAESRAHDPAAEMAEAAQRFIKSLDKDKASKALHEFDDKKKRTWHFLPDKFIPDTKTRFGLSFNQMTQQQRALAQGLLATGLSHRGYLEAMTIVSLEQILFELEKAPHRDAGLYYVSIYGKPSATGTWFWRFEGHHLSINVTIVEGKLFSLTPSFFGANPAEVKQGPFKGLQVLREEQQLARKLVKSLSPKQRKIAIIETKAPADVITKWDRKVDVTKFQPVKGIRLDQLDAKQQVQLVGLIEAFAKKYRKSLVDNVDARKKLLSGSDVYFAWAGGIEPGEGHYYRIQTPEFLFEYDNTQNNANHIHAVWRDFAGDFGEDLLKKHYEAAHKK